MFWIFSNGVNPMRNMVQGRVSSSVRETIALLLNGFSPRVVLSLSWKEKQSTQNTMKGCQEVHRCFTSLRFKLFLVFRFEPPAKTSG
jgi:hypothetical protein